MMTTVVTPVEDDRHFAKEEGLWNMGEHRPVHPNLEEDRRSAASTREMQEGRLA